LSPKKPKKMNELTTKYKDTMSKMDIAGASRHGARQQSTKLPNLNHSSYESNSSYRHNPHSGENEGPSIRFVSMIDSKPVYPAYLNLVPLKQFNKKESEMSRMVSKDPT
jgi:hypothetical protein